MQQGDFSFSAMFTLQGTQSKGKLKGTSGEGAEMCRGRESYSD